MQLTQSRAVRFGLGWAGCVLLALALAILMHPFSCSSTMIGVGLALQMLLMACAFTLAILGFTSARSGTSLRLLVFLPLALASVIWGLCSGFAWILSGLCDTAF